MRPDSDFDIAYLSDSKLSHYERFLLSQELANMINYNVDLIDLINASTVFQAEIIHNGKVIYCADDERRINFEMKTLKMYAKLNEERIEILKNIKKRGSIYNNQVILNKISTIERCISRINEVYDNTPLNLNDFTKQDSIILNIQRACEACIDLAMHLVPVRKLGIPQTSRDAFDLLVANSLLSQDLSTKLKAMVGFRNIAVHDYQSVNLDIVEKIIENHLGDFKTFTQHIIKISDTF